MLIKIFTGSFKNGILKSAIFPLLKSSYLMRPSFSGTPFFIIICLLAACKTTYQPTSVQYKDYRIAQQQPANNELTAMLQPYADSVNKNMNDVIAIAAVELEKKQPEGTLGNVLADAMLYEAREKFNAPVDAAFINYGGIRLTSLAAGNITRGKIFEMSPFDNMIVLQKINGHILQQFLNIVASRGGWPCAGIQFKIKNKLAIDIVIAGRPFSETDTYTIAQVDYIANGADDCTLLKTIPQQNKGYLLREAIVEYFAKQHKENKTISSFIQNRISYAE